MVFMDASHLFSSHVTWIGFRRGVLLRKYMYDFVHLLAPHLDRRVVDRAHRMTSGEGSRNCSPTSRLLRAVAITPGGPGRPLRPEGRARFPSGCRQNVSMSDGRGLQRHARSLIATAFQQRGRPHPHATRSTLRSPRNGKMAGTPAVPA